MRAALTFVAAYVGAIGLSYLVIRLLERSA